MLMGALGAFMWPPSFGRDCRLGLALRRQESLGFECSHTALPSSGHRLAIDIVPHEEPAILEDGLRSIHREGQGGPCLTDAAQ